MPPVATMLRVLEKKELVATQREGRADVYRPLLSRDDYELRSVRVLTKKLFDRQPAALVRRLLDAEDLSRDELEAIRKLLEEKLQ